MKRSRDTPAREKELSLAKDRRNAFAERGSHARTSVAKARALSNRSLRHRENQAIATGKLINDEDALVQAELQVENHRPRWWRKIPDEPLGKVLQEKTSRRASVAVSRRKSSNDG